MDSVEDAYEKAQQAARDKAVGVQGPSVAQQLLTRGLVDEIAVHIVPVLFGSGVRLFEQLGGEHITLEKIEVIETPEATHMRFRVVK